MPITNDRYNAFTQEEKNTMQYIMNNRVWIDNFHKSSIDQFINDIKTQLYMLNGFDISVLLHDEADDLIENSKYVIRKYTNVNTSEMKKI